MAGNILQALGLQAAPAPDPQQQDLSAWLSGLGGQPAAQTPVDQAQAAPVAPQPDPQTVAPQPQVNALQQITQPPAAPAPDVPRPRHSIIDTLGKIANAFAVGGHATPQFGPQGYWQRDQVDRANALADHAQASTLNNLKIASNTMDNTTQGNKMLAQAVRGAQAIQAAGGDVAKAWPVLAQQVGLDPQHAQAIGNIIANDPQQLAGLVAELNGPDGKSKFGLNLAYTTDADGKTHAYQVNENGDPAHEVVFPTGQAPANGIKMVDTGNGTVAVDARTGQPVRTFTKQGAPEKGEIVAQDANGNPVYRAAPGSRQELDQTIAKRKQQLAEQAAADKQNKGEKAGDPFTIYSGARTQLKMMSDALADLRSDPALSSATGYIAGAIDTPSRQKINAKIKAIEGMSVPVATAILKAQGVSRPAQAEVLSTAKGIISDLGLTRQSTQDYINSIDRAQHNLLTRTKGLDDTALRNGVITPKGTPNRQAAPQTSNRALPPRLPVSGGGGGGWGKATVVN